MFTRFLAPPRPRTAPLPGTVASLAMHAAVLAVVVGGGPAGGGGTETGEVAPLDGEALHWVGTGSSAGDGAPARPARPGALPPVAYVTPGRGVPREPRLRAPGLPNRRSRTRLPLVPPMEDVAVLVPGVVSSAPDPARSAARAEEFARLRASDLAAELLLRAEVRATEGPRPTVRVDELPIAMIGNPRPAYPLLLARARVGGRVVVEFVIDSVGVVDLGSLRVLQSTNVEFTQAVRTVLPRLRFLPAQVGRHAVGVTVRQPFVFTIRPGT